MDVMKLVSRLTKDEDLLCAALLHDYVEDCDEMLTETEKYTVLADMFNERVSDLVKELTRPVEALLEDPQISKYKYMKRVFGVNGTASDDAKLIKLMDRYSNVRDFHWEVKNNKDFYYGKYALQAVPLLKNYTSNDQPLAIIKVMFDLENAIADYTFSSTPIGDFTEEEILEYLK